MFSCRALCGATVAVAAATGGNSSACAAGGARRCLSRGAAAAADANAATGQRPSGTARDLLGSFKAIEKLEEGVFRNSSALWTPSYSLGAAFGGQVMGQAMAAAGRTASAGLILHSAHAYFVRPASSELPIAYHVEKTKDGGVFNTRNVSAKQNGKTVLSLMASFHKVEDGCLNYQLPAPHVPHHTDLPLLDVRKLYEERKHSLSPAEDAYMMGHVKTDLPLDLKPVDPEGYYALRPVARRTFWVKAKQALGDDYSTHQGVMLCASDFLMLACGFSNKPAVYFHPTIKLIVASLDHTIWFHRPAKADDWLLFDAGEENSGGSRSSLVGHVWTSDGVLVATFAQEGLIRPMQSEPK